MGCRFVCISLYQSVSRPASKIFTTLNRPEQARNRGLRHRGRHSGPCGGHFVSAVLVLIRRIRSDTLWYKIEHSRRVTPDTTNTYRYTDTRLRANTCKYKVSHVLLQVLYQLYLARFVRICGVSTLYLSCIGACLQCIRCICGVFAEVSVLYLAYIRLVYGVSVLYLSCIIAVLVAY